MTPFYFCALQNLPIVGDTDETAIFNKLLEYRIDANDIISKCHLKKPF